MVVVPSLNPTVPPSGLTRTVQVGLATLTFVVNVAIYWQILGRHLRRVRDVSEHHDGTA